MKSKLCKLTVTVRVKTDEFVIDDVEKAVDSALVDYFTLKSRKLGVNLYLSEIYKVVEGIQGVQNSVCVLNGDKAVQIVRAENDSTVIYLDTDSGASLSVNHEEYLP